MWVTPRGLGDYLNQESATKEPVARLFGIADGRDGIVITLKTMRQLVREAVRSPDQGVRNKARSITASLPPRQWRMEVEALTNFVKYEIRYLRDPVDIELVQTPDITLEYGQGDCDDKATLLAALLESTGHPARFIAVGMDGGPLSHVLVQTIIGDDWVSLETIIDKPVGWFPPNMTSKYILKI